MPPTPQPTTPMPLTIVVWESVPTQVSGYAVQLAVDLAGEHDAGQVLDVDLVHDAGAGRDDLEVLEGTLSPPQELVALAVALVLDLDVAAEGLRGAEDIGDDRVVDDQLGGRERVDLGGVAAEVRHRLAHGRQVDDAGHAGEVLHDHARRRELDLLVGVGVGVPAGEGPDVVGGDVGAVLGAQQVLEQHLQGERQALDVQPVAGDGVQPEDLVGLAAHVERALGSEAVLTGHPPSPRRVVSSLFPILPLRPEGVEGGCRGPGRKYLDVKISQRFVSGLTWFPTLPTSDESASGVAAARAPGRQRRAGGHVQGRKRASVTAPPR